MRWGILSFILFFPVTSNAAVIINEVAWMGSLQSANHEWIELHNTGAAIDVTGWEISDDMNLRIPLTGTIGANSYAVLERTSDASASGVAFLTYAGALVNTGATIVLKRSDGGIEDQVAGGADWKSIGGDNVTKETAQYTSGGWVTGAGTPGSQNAGSPTSNTDDNDNPAATTTATATTGSNSTGTARRSSPSETVRLVLPDVSLQLAIDGQKVGYVNQQIDFTVDPSGVGDTIADSLAYQWNFGDGLASQGSEVSHAFLYPGTYVVTVYGSFKRQEQLARHEITILPVAVSLTRSPRGDIQINNKSPYEIDISKYQLKSDKTFSFPNYSILLPNQTITIPREKIGGVFVRLFDALGFEVASLFSVSTNSGTAPEKKSVARSVSTILTAVPSAVSQTASSFSFLNTTVPPEATSSSEVVLEVEADKTDIDTPKPATNEKWPYVALLALIVLGVLGLVFKPVRNETD